MSKGIAKPTNMLSSMATAIARLHIIVALLAIVAILVGTIPVVIIIRTIRTIPVVTALTLENSKSKNIGGEEA